MDFEGGREEVVIRIVVGGMHTEGQKKVERSCKGVDLHCVKGGRHKGSRNGGT